jgi:iron complex outermembrane receptor protein
MPIFSQATRLSARMSARALAMSSVSCLALVAGLVPAQAQTAAPQTAQAPAIEEVVVTGSRIVRDGYEAPTPVTVVGPEQIEAAAKPNVFDAIATMPAFAGNTNITSTNVNITVGTAGQSTLNLRRMGPNRTLVLLDGRRFPDTFATGGTDAKLFPDLLISRVDVVTGGASAVYGSDAVAGVVNFILDTDFVGLKGNVMTGVTGRGDHRQYKVGVAGGTTFAEGRGHFVIAADYGYQQDMDGNARDWNQQGFFQFSNPAYGTGAGQSLTNPQLLVRNHVGLWSSNAGGIIASGPLKGIAFGPGGSPYNYNFGDLVSGSYNTGGGWQQATMQGENSLSAGVIDKHLFAHASYEITDDIKVFAQYNFGTVSSTNKVANTYYLGTLAINTQNPFIPASVAAQAAALKLTSFSIGKQLADLGEFAGANNRNSFVYTVGANGGIDAFDTRWKWDFYAQRGLMKLDNNSPYQSQLQLVLNAVDAVRAPNGSIVCRSTLTAPNNGCVPYNPFGTDSNSRAALDYVTGAYLGQHPHNSQQYGETSTAFNITGEPFSNWAGPVSVAAGAEWRRKSIVGNADPVGVAKGYFSTNYTTWPYAAFSAAEGSLETVVPLAKDTAWAKSLDFNGAVRLTSYNISGTVVTWKAGATYNPIDDLRFRVTQSRDIRAPNLNDLFAPGVLGHGSITDPFKGNITAPYNSASLGNTALVPEKANTTGLGVVYQPSWFQGFSTSLDYYDIRLHGAISSPTASTIMTQCYAGVTLYCPYIIRDSAGVLQEIDTKPVNAATLWVRGFDIEASYRTPLSAIVDSWNGDLAIRLVATRNLAYKQLDQALSISTGSINDNAPPWNGSLSISYSNDPIRVTFNEQYISGGKMYRDMIQCAAGSCPTPIPAGVQTIESNHVDAYYKTDMSIAYSLYKEGKSNAELYFNIDNLFDRDPPAIAQTGNAYGPQTNASLFDVYGRSFRLGVRFKM